MFAFLRKQKRRKQFLPFPTGYTAEEFRSNPGMVNLAQEWQRSGLGRNIMAALHNGMPYGFPMRGSDVNSTTAAIELGRVQGYMDCLNLLNLLCSPPVTMDEVEQDYGAGELLEQEGLKRE